MRAISPIKGQPRTSISINRFEDVPNHFLFPPMAVEPRCGAAASGRTYPEAVPFVWRCLNRSTMAPFPHSVHNASDMGTACPLIVARFVCPRRSAGSLIAPPYGIAQTASAAPAAGLRDRPTSPAPRCSCRGRAASFWMTTGTPGMPCNPRSPLSPRLPWLAISCQPAPGHGPGLSLLAMKQPPLSATMSSAL